MAFHRAVILAAHNDVLTQLFDVFLPRLRLAMIDMLRIRPVASEAADHAAHERLVESIAVRDAAAASAASRTHLSGLKEAFE
jgi:DNA-binding FadR family transcriptional regulator